ncbi:SUMF1/EgtB/PvdO family nonheme iron enzyme [candidate division KSB1 bacterium]|nr:SUMF1/EgtB/PvdO family nonheme iron enzyme [candidate division KSB1 bacterium]
MINHRSQYFYFFIFNIFLSINFNCDKEPTGSEKPSIDKPPTAIEKKIDMVMIHIPAGEFIMGSNYGYFDEKPVHTVYLDDYWIDKFEVTNAHYTDFLNSAYREGRIQTDGKTVTQNDMILYNMNIEGSVISFDGDSFSLKSGYLNLPVTNVTWQGANTFAMYYGKRIPTEAEWEKAARGTDSRLYPWGDIPPNDSLCNYKSHIGFLNIVDFYSPAGDSPYGCCNMAGNALEWCDDWYLESYYCTSPVSNPKGPYETSRHFKVVRGGSFVDIAHDVRCACRFHLHMEPNVLVGFRCAR